MESQKIHPNAGRKNILWNAGVYLLASICFERIVYFGMSASLTIFFSKVLELNSSLSIRLQAIFLAAVYVSPVIFCYLADTRFGRFKSIFYGHLPYLIGLVLCLISTSLGSFIFDSTKKLSTTQTAITALIWCIGLYVFFPVGTGTIKPNLVVLGGDQYPETTEKERRRKNSFFDAFYFCQNIGAFVAFFFLTSLAVNGIGGIQGAKYKFHRFFYLTLICFVFSLLSFLSIFFSKKHLALPEVEGSAFNGFISALYSVWTTNIYSIATVLGSFAMTFGLFFGIIGTFVLYKNIISIISLLFITLGAAALVLSCPKANTWININATNLNKIPLDTIVGYQNIVKTITFLPYSIFYWAAYNSMDTTFILQGCQMKTQIFSWYNMPPPQLSTWNSLIIMAVIPVCDMVIYPFFTRIGFPLTSLRKVFIGFLWTALGMAAAGILEIIRKNSPLIPTQSSCFDLREQLIYERDISILYQIIQFGLIGFSEVFAAIAFFDFYHTENPENLRSICQSLNMLTVSLGAIAGSTIVSIFSHWIPNDLDGGHMDYFLFLLAGLNFANAILFGISALGYKYRSFTPILETPDLGSKRI